MPDRRVIMIEGDTAIGRLPGYGIEEGVRAGGERDLQAKPLRVAVLIRSLEAGGAQAQLAALAKVAKANGMELVILQLYEGGAFADYIRSMGTPLISLRKSGRWDFLFVFRLIKAVRCVKPHVIYGVMSVSNELALIVGRICGAKVVWGIRSSFVDLEAYDWAARLIHKVGALLSVAADAIVFNSVAGKKYYGGQGYRNRRMRVVHNGIDIARFVSDRRRRNEFRRELGVDNDECLIGLVGRLDPMKDHQTFLQAAAAFCQQGYRGRFICIGQGEPEFGDRLRAAAAKYGLAQRVIWLSGVGDMVAAYNGIDVLTLTSRGEGFPNVVAEAMACGLPCVVTDVGDCRDIVGGIWPVVAVGDHERVVNGWRQVLEMSADERGAKAQAARDRVLMKFGIDALGTATADIMREVSTSNS